MFGSRSFVPSIRSILSQPAHFPPFPLLPEPTQPCSSPRPPGLRIPRRENHSNQSLLTISGKLLLHTHPQRLLPRACTNYRNCCFNRFRLRSSRASLPRRHTRSLLPVLNERSQLELHIFSFPSAAMPSPSAAAPMLPNRDEQAARTAHYCATSAVVSEISDSSLTLW